MTTIGIIGGLGPESTIEYYRFLVAEFRRQRPDDGYPSIVINSIDVSKMVRLMTANDLSGAAEYLIREVRRLGDAGCTVGLIAANTPHVVFDEVASQSPIPLVSIVEETAVAATALGLRRLGLFGTRFTMQGKFYPAVFVKHGLELIVPTEDEQTFVHDKYLNELLNDIFLPETRERLLAIADRMIAEDRIEGLILGGTELPLILKEKTWRGIPLLDTTQIHVNAIVTLIARSSR